MNVMQNALRRAAGHGKKIALAVSLVAAGLTVSGTASAQHAHDGPHGGPHGGWHGDIAHFHAHDWGVWRGGRWNHGWHNGVFGWWWFAGGIWYPYPAPVYPYPNPWEPPVVVTAPGPAVAPPATRYWYFCRPTNAYYPYVASCPQAWEQVPAQPAPGP